MRNGLSNVQLYRNNQSQTVHSCSTPAALKQGLTASRHLISSHSSLIVHEIWPCIQLEEWPSKLFWSSRHSVTPLCVTAGVLSARGSQREKTKNLRENSHTGPTCWSLPYWSTISCNREELAPYTRYWYKKLPFWHNTHAIYTLLKHYWTLMPEYSNVSQKFVT